ncbi:unnamed protein product [Caenorhabditis nigoni]
MSTTGQGNHDLLANTVVSKSTPAKTTTPVVETPSQIISSSVVRSTKMIIDSTIGTAIDCVKSTDNYFESRNQDHRSPKDFSETRDIEVLLQKASRCFTELTSLPDIIERQVSALQIIGEAEFGTVSKEIRKYLHDSEYEVHLAKMDECVTIIQQELNTLGNHEANIEHHDPITSIRRDPDQIGPAINMLGNKLNDFLKLQKSKIDIESKDEHHIRRHLSHEQYGGGRNPQNYLFSRRHAGRYAESYAGSHVGSYAGNYAQNHDPEMEYISNLSYGDVLTHLTIFDGSKNFRIFSRNFQRFVINNPTFTDDMKYNLMEQYIVGPASTCIQHLDDTAEAVKQTFVELEYLYGEKEDRMSLHEKLIDLPFHQSDLSQMLMDLQAHRVIVNLLKEQSLNVDDERTILPICRKFPEHIIEGLIRILPSDTRDWTFVKVNETVINTIKTLQKKKKICGSQSNTSRNGASRKHASILIADQQSSVSPFQYSNSNQHAMNEFRDNGNSGYNGNQNKNHRKEGPMNKVLRFSFPFIWPEQRNTCKTCNGPHHSIRCPLPSWEFRRMSKDKNLCELCLNEGHSVQQCNSTFRCGYCRDRHHMGGCKEKEYYRDVNNYPASAGPIVGQELEETFFRGPSQFHH